MVDMTNMPMLGTPRLGVNSAVGAVPAAKAGFLAALMGPQVAAVPTLSPTDPDAATPATAPAVVAPTAAALAPSPTAPATTRAAPLQQPAMTFQAYQAANPGGYARAVNPSLLPPVTSIPDTLAAAGQQATGASALPRNITAADVGAINADPSKVAYLGGLASVPGQSGTPDRAAAVGLSQAGMQQQGSDAAWHIPKYMLPQLFEAVGRGNSLATDPVAGLTQSANDTYAATAAQIQAQQADEFAAANKLADPKAAQAARDASNAAAMKSLATAQGLHVKALGGAAIAKTIQTL